MIQGGRPGARAAVVATGAAVAALLVWASSGSAVRLAEGRVPHPARSVPPLTPVPQPTPTGTTGLDLDRAMPEWWTPPTFDLHRPAQVLGTVLLVLAAAALARWLWRQWRQRWRPPVAPDTAAMPLAVPPPPVIAALSGRRADHLDTLRDGVPRNAIVACWVDLEDTVRASGVPADPALTSAELTQWVLTSLDVDPQSVLDLAGLYREARFSAHELGEGHRAAAVRAVRRLHEDLAVARHQDTAAAAGLVP